ncbi:MAG: MFS transporter, partial [Lachnospiraceae bacterium]|nr:MFS transporter [Lachnospiraceae bacterium]
YGIKIKNTFKALSIMGTGATVMYIILIRMTSTGPAALALGLFSVFLAGIYPMAVASVGKMMSSASVGVLLSIGGLGGIIFPWFVGIVADNTTLRTGMAVNIIPCVGVLLLSLVMLHLTGKEEEKAE